LLDQTKLAPFLDKYFADTRHERLVGLTRQYDSGYIEIIRFFGDQAIDPCKIALNYLSESFRFNDERIKQFSRIIEQELRQQGRLTKGPPVMKLVSFEQENRPPTMTLQAARYGDFAGSCFALDYEHPLFADWGGSLRDYYRVAYPSNTVIDNPLAICLGTSGMLLVQEKEGSFLLRVRRAKHLATMTGSYGSSVAGVVDYKTEYCNLSELMISALSQEVEEEINLTRDEYEVVPLAYTREVLRGEHPQLFCLVNTDLNRREISARLEALKPDAREYDRFDFIPLGGDGALSKDDLASLNFEGRINYYLVEEYLVSAG
jgi:hypothetical protein